MSFDGNVGLITSEFVLFLENAHMSLEGNFGGYTLQSRKVREARTTI